MIIKSLITCVLAAFCFATFAGDNKSLIYYENRNPHRDAELAIKNNDLKFIAMAGIDVEIPGIDDYASKYKKYGYVLIEDSSDSIENYEHGRLMVIAKYYAENYNEEIASRILYIENINLAKSLDGWDKLEKNFDILSISVGISLSSPYEKILAITLKNKNSNCVDGISWSNQFSSGRLAYNWDDMIEMYKKINQVTCRHNWAIDWLRSGSQRSLWAYGYGSSPSNIDSLSISGAAWKDARLNGVPYYEIGMLEGDIPVGNFYISKDGENAVIVTLHKTKGNLWINQQEISYFPTSIPRSIIAVNKNGNWKKYEIKNKDALM